MIPILINNNLMTVNVRGLQLQLYWDVFLSHFIAIKEKFEKICQKKELKCQYFVTDTHQRPGHVICELAAQKKADSITVGQRGLGTLSRTLVGSTSDYILHHSNVPVMVVPPKK